MKQILINSEEMQTRVAVVVDGVLHDFFMERKSRDQMVGSIYKGVIRNLEPSLQAAFVDIGVGKNAFLHYWDMIPATQDMLEGDGDVEEDDRDEEIPPATPQPRKQTPQVLEVQMEEERAPKTQHQRWRRHSRKGQQKQLETQSQPQPPVEKDESKGFFARLCSLFSRKDKPEPTAPVQEAPKKGNNQQQQQKQKQQQQQQQQQKRQPKQQQQQRQPKQQQKPAITADDIPNLFKPGQEILVQVTKGPIGTKGARVTTNLSIAGRYLVFLPNSPHLGVSKRVEEKAERERLRKMLKSLEIPKGMGLICRTVAAGCKIEHVQRDLDFLLDSWNAGKGLQEKKAPVCVYREPALADRALRDCLTEDVDEIVTDSEEVYKRANDMMKRYGLSSVRIKMYTNPTPIFNKYGLSQQLMSLFNRKVNLPGGGYICIDETEALIAIDVNTGKNRTGKDQPETILATNLEAVNEIARQLRLRNVGGLVVLDLIDMRSKSDQMTVYRALKERLAEDRARTRVCQISSLGLLEMTRQRENESLESTMFDNCPYCKGRGLVKSATSMSVDIQRKLNEILARKHYASLTVCVHPRNIERLKNEDRKLISAIEKENKTTISIQADPMFHVEEFQITDTVTGTSLGKN
ncbi:MAG: Rne/Rng family ribonuclease [Victivallales bacterium]|nr:Rne/Rng family ribonuclease [Victivallales bacterium]